MSELVPVNKLSAHHYHWTQLHLMVHELAVRRHEVARVEMDNVEDARKARASVYFAAKEEGFKVRTAIVVPSDESSDNDTVFLYVIRK